MSKVVIYNHGKGSIPWGEKALALAAVSQDLGYEFISPDYQTSDDPDIRVQQLLSLDISQYQQVVLVGSSMGAYVATVASAVIKPVGLFLIAPAFFLSGYQCTEFTPSAQYIEVFHGWQDDVVPPENSWRFCQQHRARLHMHDADHRLLSILPLMVETFSRFLNDCKSSL